MVTDAGQFFAKRQGAAAIKHDILGSYLVPYVMRVGRHAPRVVYVDGYAGPGVYDEGDPGSPELALDVAEAIKQHRKFVGHFIEERGAFVESLRTRVAQRGADEWHVHHGDVATHLRATINDAGTDPLLVLLDPYGLTIPFQELVDRLLKRSSITEVVINFSLAALQRLGGFLDKDYAILTEPGPGNLFGPRSAPQLTAEEAARNEGLRDKMIKRLDDFLGGRWWHDMKRTGHTTWREEVRDEYLRTLCSAGGASWRHWTVPIPENVGGNPVYDLVLLTRHPHGTWLYNDAASRAYFRHLRQSWAEEGDNDGRLDLPGDVDVDALGSRFEEMIAAHVQQAVASGQTFVAAGRMDLIFPEELRGKAGHKHARAALKKLYEQQIIGGHRQPYSDGLEDFVVTPGPRAAD